MKKGCFIILILFLTLLAVVILLFRNRTEPEYYTEIVPQKVGGKLLCDAETHVDLHTGHFSLKYRYVNGNDTVRIGDTRFSGGSWIKKEQLIRFQTVYILKSRYSYNGNIIFIGDKNTNDWKQFVILPEKIEDDSLWKSCHIHSLTDYSPSSSLITRIDSGLIYVEYKYRVDKRITGLIGTSQIVYRLSAQKRNIKMISIKVLKKD